MSTRKSSRAVRNSRLLALTAVTSLLAGSVFPAYAIASQEQTESQEQADKTVPAPTEYKIGPGDVLSVSITEAPEFGGKILVNDAGLIDIVGVGEPLHAEGLTPVELSRAIRDALVKAKQLRDPKVRVFVEEYHGRTITVLGAVNKPQ